MFNNDFKEMELNIKNAVLSKFPLLGVTMANIKIVPTFKVQTAATNGRELLYNPYFIKGLSHDQRVFVFAHEYMHDAFDHIPRRKGKDAYIWNLATDSVINQILMSENLPIIEGGVNIKEALNKSAEEMYKNLLEKKNEKDKEKQQQGGGEGKSGKGQSSIDDFENQTEPKNHDVWEQSSSLDKAGENKDFSDTKQKNLDEKEFAKKNSEMKRTIGEQIRNKLKDNAGKTAGGLSTNLGSVGYAKPAVSWKKILKREVEKEEEWSYRRANEENDWQARIGSFDVDEKAITEVLLDTSGSVDESMLRNFLRQLKPLLKESKLYVGCFDTRFYGFTEIKTMTDIDKFNIIGRGGTSFDMAIRSFTNNKNSNKVIFTDGYDTVSNNEYNKSMKKLYWLVWDKKDFTACCGKVINVDSNEIKFQNDLEK